MSTLVSSIETQARRHLLEPAALATPGSITVTQTGSAGSTSITYKLVAINASGTTDAGAASTTTTANATLSGSNYNVLTWTAVTNATGYWIYRTVSGGSSPTTTGRIVVLGAVTTYNDQGAAGDTTVPPVSNTTGLTSPFWSSDELVAIINNGVKACWRDVVDLKQEHYLTIDTTNVSLSTSSSTLTGVPSDVHKLYLIEPRNVSESGTNRGLIFRPADYNSPEFQQARTRDAIDPTDDIIFYAIHGAGGPVSAPTVYVAPQVTSAVNLSFSYVPTLALLTSSSTIPIPGEADQALIAWTVAYARAKEREDRSPDPSWLSLFSTEKSHLLQSLGMREYQENTYVHALYEGYW